MLLIGKEGSPGGRTGVVTQRGLASTRRNPFPEAREFYKLYVQSILTMASKLPPRLLSHFPKHARRRPICPHTPNPFLPSLSCAQPRHASTFNPLSDNSIPEPETRDASNSSPAEMEVYGASRPRWSYTPPLMKAPIPLNLKKPGNEIRINSDPAKLDEVYVRMLGRDGDKMLSDEVKWLAVTHKSFDHGRRGFNDRLAYLGRLRVSFRVWLLVG